MDTENAHKDQEGPSGSSKEGLVQPHPSKAKMPPQQPARARTYRCRRAFDVPVDGKTGDRTTTYYQEGQEVSDPAEVAYLLSVAAPMQEV